MIFKTQEITVVYQQKDDLFIITRSDGDSALYNSWLFRDVSPDKTGLYLQIEENQEISRMEARTEANRRELSGWKLCTQDEMKDVSIDDFFEDMPNVFSIKQWLEQ